MCIVDGNRRDGPSREARGSPHCGAVTCEAIKQVVKNGWWSRFRLFSGQEKKFGNLLCFQILQLSRQLEVGFKTLSHSHREDEMEETPAVSRFIATRTGSCRQGERGLCATQGV